MTRQTINVARFAAAALALFAASLVRAATVPESLNALFEAHLGRIEAPGFSVVVVENGGILLSKGYGVNVAGQRDPLTDNTVMAIGSVTKSFTALAIMQLADRGLLELDDPIIKYLPWFRTADKSLSDTLTIRMCLNNTTGLAASFATLTRNQSRQPDALEQGIRAMSSYQMRRVPGESFEYLNEGWNVLGLIVETITKQAWEDYIADHIFEPLEMDRSSAKRKELETWNVATGHYAGVVPEPASFLHIQGSLPAGSGLYSNAENLGHYLIALLDGGRYKEHRVLSGEGVRAMWTPAIPFQMLPRELGGTGDPAHYAMGWIVLEIDGHVYVGHGGEFRTMSSMVLLDPENHSGVAMLYNTGALDPYQSESPYHVTYNALRLVQGKPPGDYGVPRERDPTANTYQPDRGGAQQHLGTYISSTGRRLDLKPGGSEGLHAYLTDGVYPADFDVDFTSTANFVLRNIAGTTRGNFVGRADNPTTAINIDGELFRRQKKTSFEDSRVHRADGSAYEFRLPDTWQVVWNDGGFRATQSTRRFTIAGMSTPDSFDVWLSDTSSSGSTERPIVLSELRNGYFFQSARYPDPVIRDGQERAALAVFVSHRGTSHVFELTAPPGDLTEAIMESLNPFLDSLFLN